MSERASTHPWPWSWTQALFTLFTYDFNPIHSSNTIVRFTDDTTIVGLTSNNEETHYREEVRHQVQWCSDNNLVLNTTKTKGIIVDFRTSRKTTHPPLQINGEEVESVNSIKFIGIHLTKYLSWSLNTSHLVRKAQQRLFFLRKTKQAKRPSQLLVNFFRNTIELRCPHLEGLGPGGQNGTEDCGNCAPKPVHSVCWSSTQ